MNDDEFKITSESKETSLSDYIAGLIGDDYNIAPEDMKGMSVSDFIARINEKRGVAPWSEDVRFLSTAVGAKDRARLIHGIVHELEGFCFKKMDERDSDEVGSILQRLSDDSFRIYTIFERYLQSLDREYFGKEGSE